MAGKQRRRPCHSIPTLTITTIDHHQHRQEYSKILRSGELSLLLPPNTIGFAIRPPFRSGKNNSARVVLGFLRRKQMTGIYGNCGHRTLWKGTNWVGWVCPVVHIFGRKNKIGVVTFFVITIPRRYETIGYKELYSSYPTTHTIYNTTTCTVCMNMSY